MSKLNFVLSILLPDKSIVSGMEVSFVTFPSVDGELGVGPNHTKTIGLLGTGIIKIIREVSLKNAQEENEEIHFFVNQGFFRIFSNQLILSSGVVEARAQIDVLRLETAERRALSRLNERNQLDVNIPRALASLERAKARKKLLEIGK